MKKQQFSPDILEPNPITQPRVSVCIVTYNHEQYIAQTLDSVLMQKTDFPFEIVLGEDVSTDKTRAICQDYADHYPSIIRLLDTPKNLGAMDNSLRTFRESRGEYIALLEGDDYWIDDKKLQKQVNALENDPKRTICFTGRKDFDEEQNVFATIHGDRGDNCFYPKDFAQDTFFHTSTALFRNPKNEDWLTKLRQFTIGDRPMFILLLMENGGYAYKLKDICSVFRLNNGSSFTPTKPLQRSILVAKMYTEMKAAFPELSIDFNRHLNVSDYFILRDAYRNKDKLLVKKLVRQILNRRTRMSGFVLKIKAFLHYFI